MHARAQPKGIRIKHRIVRINHVDPKRTISSRLWRLHLRPSSKPRLVEVARWWRVHLIVLRRVCAMQLIRRRVGVVVGIGLVEHGPGLLRIVLLLCTHESILGRQSSANRGWRNLPSWSMCFWNGLG